MDGEPRPPAMNRRAFLRPIATLAGRGTKQPARSILTLDGFGKLRRDLSKLGIRSANSTDASASLTRSSSATASSKRCHTSSGPRRPDPGYRSNGGVAPPGVARHSNPSLWAASHAAARCAAAARFASRPLKPGSGGARTCSRSAARHDSRASWKASSESSVTLRVVLPRDLNEARARSRGVAAARASRTRCPTGSRRASRKRRRGVVHGKEQGGQKCKICGCILAPVSVATNGLDDRCGSPSPARFLHRGP